MSTTISNEVRINDHEGEQIERANTSGRTPVESVHGLWLLPSSWDASYKRQKHNEGLTEVVEIKDRGHALTIDSGWREVADTALQFIQRFV